MKIIFPVFLFLFGIVSFGQNIDREVIKGSGHYYFGEATAVNVREAEDRALASLTQSIAVNISSEFKTHVVESTKNLNETVENIVKTYSTATLRNVKTDRIKNDNDFNVFRYIEKSEVEVIFAARKDLVRSIFTSAEKHKNDGNFGYALKLYYFALVLINSLPDQQVSFNSQNLVTIIPEQINGIINSLKFNCISDRASDDERIVEFVITAYDKPAVDLEFSFWDGNDQVDVRAKDGKGVMQFFGSSFVLKKLDVQIKYAFYESKEEIKEVSELWDLVIKPQFKNTRQISLEIIPVQISSLPAATGAQTSVTDGSSSSTTSTAHSASAGTEIVSVPMTASVDTVKRNHFASMDKFSFSLALVNKDTCPHLQKIATETLNLLELMKKKNVSSLNKFLGEDEFLKKKVSDMIKYNGISFTNMKIDGVVSKTVEGWEMRKIEILANYSSIKKQSKEYLVLDYDKDGNLYDLNFGISEAAYRNFQEINPSLRDWDKKQVMIKFIEKYRTAYLDRDLKMLGSLFSDDALIIVGRVLETAKITPNEMYKYIPMAQQPNFEQVKYSKEQYLKKQADLFASRKDLFLGFSTLSMNKKNAEQGVYGLSMRQHFNSTGYSDEGYLFLLVDFKQALPRIYVRSWQPQEYNDEALIQLSSFKLNK